MSKTDLEPFRGLFEGARQDAFTPAEVDRLWQSLSTASAPGLGSAAASGLKAQALRSGWSGATGAIKIAALVLVVGGVGAAGLAASRVHPPVVELPSPSVPVATRPGGQPAIATVHDVAGPPTVSWEELPRSPEPPASPPAHARARTPAGPAAERAPEVEAPTPEIAAPTADAVEAVAQAENPAPESAPPSEGALLLRARKQLASDPAAALSLTDEVSRRFPAGPLAPEREVLAIEALAKLGRTGEARARFVTFRARYPQSPHLERLQRLVGP
jgi:hypothetical protein